MLSRTLRVASRRALATSIRPSTLASTPRVLAPAASVGAVRSYHERVLDHYSKPRNVGSMNKADADVGTGLVGAPACGDVMKLQIRVDPNTNTISDVKFKTFGCGSAIASSSYLTELVRGMSLDQASKVKNTEIARELCLPPVKCTYFLSLSPLLSVT
jgi:Fe-S cluster assembly scaffold IscU